MSKEPKIIMFNGPPNSGKDTLADELVKILGPKALRSSFALSLKDLVATALFVTVEDVERHKDEAMNVAAGGDSMAILALDDVTFRDALIYFSEGFMKPLFGHNIWGKTLSLALKLHMEEQPDTEFCVISDLGFEDELQTFIDDYGAENVLVVRVSRHDTSFENDSRHYVECKDCAIIGVKNENKTPNEVCQSILEANETFFN